MNRQLIKILSGYMAISDRYQTKTALAEALHLSRPSFSDRWTGKIDFRLDEIVLLCKILKVSDADKIKILTR